MSTRMLFRGEVLCALGMLLAMPGCGNQAAPGSPKSDGPTASAAPDNQKAPEAGGLRTIDPPVDDTALSRIAEKADIKVDGEPACAFSVQYARAVPQPVTWRKEPCSAVNAAFLSRKELADLDKMDRLSAETLADIDRDPARPVFYIEGQFTASIYQLNVAGRIYEVPVAD